MKTKSTFNAESAGETKKTKILILWFSHASAKVLLVLSTSNASRVGCLLKSKKSHLTSPIKMWGPSTGNDLNVRSANICTPTRLKLTKKSSRLSTFLKKSALSTEPTTFFSNRCLWTRTRQETSTCWMWLPTRMNSNWAEATNHRCELMTLVSVDAMPSLSASPTDFTSKTTRVSLEQSSFLRTSWDSKRLTPWRFKWAELLSLSLSSTSNPRRRSWNLTFRKS